MISHRGTKIKEEFFTETAFLQIVGGSEVKCCQLFNTYCRFGQVKLLNEVNKTEMNNRYYLMYQYIALCVKGYTGGSCVATSQLNTHRGRDRR